MHRITWKGIILLLLFPLLFLISQVLMKYNYGYFYISDFDPVYAFLFNGLNLARGISGTGLAGFPGTTMQFFIAAIIHLEYFFREGTSISKDVLLNPEYYLHMASIGMVLMNTIAFFLTGLLIFRRTGKYDVSVFLQFTPFISVFGFYYGTLIMCEPFMLLGVQIIILQLALFYYSDKNTLSNKQILIIAVATGFGIATKISFFPVFFLPFTVINGCLARMKYTFYTLITIGILALPLYSNISDFFSWTKMIFVHSGLYGTGDQKIIDVSFFVENLMTILSENIIFTLIIAGLGVYFLLRISRHFRKKIPFKDHQLLKGFSIVIFLLILLLSKHYRPYYTGFFHGLCLFPAVLLVRIFKYFPVHSIHLEIKSGLSTFLVMLTGIGLSFRLYHELNLIIQKRNIFSKSVADVHQIVGNNQKILVSEFGSSAFEEGALHFGKEFSLNQKDYYTVLLSQLYPRTYFYNISQERYYDWNSDISPMEILSRNQTTWLFRKSKNDTIPASLLNELLQLKKAGLITTFDLEYKNPEAFDYLYKIESDTNALKKYDTVKETIVCDCESTSADGKVFVSADGEYIFGMTHMRSMQQVHDGQYAVRLNVDNPYALGIRLKVNKNDYVKTSVWRNSQDDKGKIVLTDDILNGIYSAGSSVFKLQDRWKRISMNFRIPRNFQGEEIHLYLWYNGKDSCYFDDFEIRVFEGMQIPDSDL